MALQFSTFIPCTLVALVVVIPLLAEAAGGGPPQLPSLNDPKKSYRLPPCKACAVLVESIYAGMKRTERNRHDGGDAQWEEERLGSYKTSELRLVEIQEKLCSELARGEDQCHQLADELDAEIEEWWLRQQQTEPDLHNYLCVQKKQVCCPDGHFGPDCSPCEDCGGNGRCKGNGTRKGNGKCACDAGYEGENCSKCAVQYYESFRDESKLLCSACYKACGDAGCLGAGPQSCLNCKAGWKLINDSEDARNGCQDVDECYDETICKTNQFCVNNEGSYSCLECDKSCDGCNGDGPDLCLKCAQGYELKDGLCTDLTSERKNQYVNVTRYLTYLGLCIATFVIFQSSPSWAAVIGLAVALYVSVSEYWLATTTHQSGEGGATGKRLPDELMEQLRDRMALK